MKNRMIIFGLVVGVLLGALPLYGAEEATPEQQEVMLQEFYNNNPILIENQQQKLKNIVKFLDDNDIKYYKIEDFDQRYIKVETQVLQNVPTKKGGRNYEVCVVKMSTDYEWPGEDPLAFYVFGDLSGNVYIDLPDSGYNITERMVPIAGHTFYGRLDPNDNTPEYVRTSIAMDSYGIASRITPVPNGTLVDETYIVPASSFSGRPRELHQEFDRLMELLLKMAPPSPGKKFEKPQENALELEIFRVYNAATAEYKELEQSPVVTEFIKRKETHASLQQQYDAAVAQKNEAVYVPLGEQGNANYARMLELFDSPEITYINKLRQFTQTLWELGRDKKTKEAHEYIINSGMAQKFNYQPPSE